MNAEILLYTFKWDLCILIGITMTQVIKQGESKYIGKTNLLVAANLQHEMKVGHFLGRPACLWMGVLWI